jgi:hypothetical protein
MTCVGTACIPSLCVERGDAGTRDAAQGGAPPPHARPREAGSPEGESPDAAGSSDAGASIDGDAGTAEAGAAPAGATDAGPEPDAGTFVPQIAPMQLGNLLELLLEVTAVAADPLRARLYAATSSESPTYPGSLVTVDSQTGVVLHTLPIAGDAESIAISDGGATLWVGSGPAQVDLRGAWPRLVNTGNSSAKRSLLPTLVPLHGSSTSVAELNTDDQVMILDDLAARPKVFDIRTGLDQIALGPDGNLFATDSSGGLHHLIVDAEGVTEQPVTMPVTTTTAPGGAAGAPILGFVNEVWDVSSPASPRLLGRLPEINRDTQSVTAILVDNRTAWVVGGDTFGANPELRVIDLSTFTAQGRLALGSGVGYLTSAPAKTLAGGLAFGARINSGSAFFILPKVGALDAIPDTRNTTTHGALIEVPIAAEHLVADSARHRLYATVFGDADRRPNQLVTLDSTSGSVLSSVVVGSNPTALALSDDGTTLWVSLEGSAEIRRVDLTTPFPTPRERYSLFAQTGQQSPAETLLALPDGAGTIAAQLYTPLITGNDGTMLVVADNGRLRTKHYPALTLASGYSQFVRGAAGYLYTVDYTTGSGLYTFDLISTTADGPVGGSSSVTVNGSLGLTYDPAGFVDASGSAIDVRVPGAPVLLGQFLGGITAPKPGTDVVFGLSSRRDIDDPLILKRGRRSTLTQESQVTLGAEGDTFANSRDIVYLDKDRVVFIAKAHDGGPATARKRSSIWFSVVPSAATTAQVLPLAGSPTTLMLTAGAGNVVSNVVLHRLDTSSFAEVKTTPLGNSSDVISVPKVVRVNAGTLAFVELGANLSFQRVRILDDTTLVP